MAACDCGFAAPEHLPRDLVKGCVCGGGGVTCSCATICRACFEKSESWKAVVASWGCCGVKISDVLSVPFPGCLAPGTTKGWKVAKR